MTPFHVSRSISIHALREESDNNHFPSYFLTIISIHALREESDACAASYHYGFQISIHALREESDGTIVRAIIAPADFNPRSP